jgi:hypothetical protein
LCIKDEKRDLVSSTSHDQSFDNLEPAWLGFSFLIKQFV